jgi:bacteriorhodopsin
MKVLNTHAFAEIADTAWKLDGPLFRTWAFAVPLGSLLAVIGALLYVKASKPLIWAVGIVVPVVVVTTIMVFSTRYYPNGFYGIGGISILLLFFSLVWLWMKKYSGLGQQERFAGSLKLIGYLFWINASWYLCGDTAKLHLKAFEGLSVPSPTETMVFLVLGWFFVALGEYRSAEPERIKGES